MSEPGHAPIRDAVLHWWFWEPFWPTAVGIALGIPVALWLYNVNSRASARQAQRTDEEWMHQVIEILRATLADQIPKLRHAVNRPDINFETIPDLGVAAWEAVRAEAFRLLPDVSLRARLATYFENVHRLNVAHEYRMQRITGRVGQPQWSDPAPTEAAMHQTLKEHASSATEEATALLEELDRLTPKVGYAHKKPI